MGGTPATCVHDRLSCSMGRIIEDGDINPVGQDTAADDGDDDAVESGAESDASIDAEMATERATTPTAAPVTAAPASPGAPGAAVGSPTSAADVAAAARRACRVTSLMGDGQAAGARVAERFATENSINDLGKNDIEKNTAALYQKIAVATEASFRDAGCSSWTAIIALSDMEEDRFMFEMKKVMVKIATASITGSDSPLKQFSGMVKRKFEVSLFRWRGLGGWES